MASRRLTLSEIPAKELDLFTARRGHCKPYIANPDLVERLRHNAPLNMPDKATFYRGGAKDIPRLPNAVLNAPSGTGG